MVRDTDRDWAKVAEENPYWGVLSEDQFKGTTLPSDKKARFYESGSKYLDNLFGFIRHHIDTNFRVQRGLDFGCGVGRLLIPLAAVADEAIGVDIAPRMLDLARENLRDAGVTNASVVCGDDSLSEVRGRFNFINSYIVLQHIPPERGIRLIRRLLDILEVRGVFSLQLTYAKERRFLQHEFGLATHYRRTGVNIQDLVSLENEVAEGTITMFDYDLNEVMLLVARVAGQPILVLPTEHDGHLGVHVIGMKVRS